MKHKGMAFLDYLLKENLDVFSAAQLVPFFGSMDTKVYVMLSDLVDRGWLTKLKKGVYARNPQERRGEKYLPNWHKVAEGLAYPHAYYIGFQSALQLHDLLTQPALKEYVVVQHRVHPKVQLILDVPFEFIYTKADRFFGFQKTWITDHDKVFSSDLEKTLIDCLYQPQYAGGLEGIVKATYKAREKIKPNVLVEYALRFKVQAVIKRLGFVLEKLDLFPTEQKILAKLITESYTKLDPSLKLSGSFHQKWKIEDNIDLEDIIQTIDT